MIININTQEELDGISGVKKGDTLKIKASLMLKSSINIEGKVVIEKNINTSLARCFVARESSQPHVVAWGSSQPHVVARESSQPRVVARESSQPRVEARESSQPHVVARESSQPHVEARESSQPHVEARESSQPRVVARESSQPHVEAWESSQVMGMNIRVETCTVNLFGFAVLTIPKSLKIKIKKTKNAVIQRVATLGWFENNGRKKTPFIILFKRVSVSFKTQENTQNETDWLVGKTIEHANWHPKENECGSGKYHACSKPYFCDEFRDGQNDKYIAIKIATQDLYEWPNPVYPHKIAFRKGTVLYECDRYGKKIKRKADNGRR